MADYSQQIADLNAAAEICRQHAITTPVNGVQPEYPRWSEAWKACEVVHQKWLDLQTMSGPDDEADRNTVITEAERFNRRSK
jgi:hypothetical protein